MNRVRWILLSLSVFICLCVRRATQLLPASSAPSPIYTTSSAMAERPRDACCGNFKRWVTSRLNLRLKGYVSRQYLWTVRWGNGYTTTLPPEVFTQINFVADFIRLKLSFIQKTKTRFSATLWGT